MCKNSGITNGSAGFHANDSVTTTAATSRNEVLDASRAEGVSSSSQAPPVQPTSPAKSLTNDDHGGIKQRRNRSRGGTSNDNTTMTASPSRPKQQYNATANQNNCRKDDDDDNAMSLPPLILVFVVFICSGFLFLFALRDFAMTGRNIFGSIDEAFLLFTKSTDWYEDAKGWKSTQGGFSAIQLVSTDQNNMGGFFVRKLAGAVGIGFQLQKIIPLLFPNPAAHWGRGHYRPWIFTSLLANFAVMAFLLSYWEDFGAHQATQLPQIWILAYLAETVVLLYYAAMQLIMARRHRFKIVSVAMPPGKKPSDPPSRVVSRTISIVTSFMMIVAIRDLFFPGQVLALDSNSATASGASLIPYDEFYLEWTNAFYHSPPPGSPEYIESGGSVQQSFLYTGDLFISQFFAIQLLINCTYKLMSALGIRYNTDGSGEMQTKMIWTVQALTNGMILLVFRLFASAATSASFDIRWHLMAVAYETFILGLYGFF